MIIELGLLAATYFGAKFYDSLMDEPDDQLDPALEAQLESDGEFFSESEPEERSPLAEEPERPCEAQSIDGARSTETRLSKEETEKHQLHYLKGSYVSMGLIAANHFIPGAGSLGIATYLYSVIPYMRDVEDSLLREKKVNADVLFFVADVLTFATGHFFTAALGLSMIYHGKYAVKRARDDSAKMVSHLYRELPQTVWKVTDGVEIEVPLDKLNVGDIILVTSGMVIPVDGFIEEGTTQIDQQALTGEAQPAEKGKGDPVFANTIVISGRASIRVDRSGADTTSAQIADMVLNSVSFKSGVQLKGERWADQMSLPMLGAATVFLPLIGPSSTAVFINSHIGARIRLFAPLTTLRHITEASKIGVLVKDGRALEQLSDVDTILFDKTGTLTTEQPAVQKVTSVNGMSSREVLTFAATAERKLTHPIARAILEKAAKEGIAPHDIQDSDYTMGYGVSVKLHGKLVRVGSLRFFQQEGIIIPDEVLEQQQACHGAGNTFILVGVDQQIEGTLEVHPQIRPEAREIISQLREYGISHIGIVSGDDQAPTRKLAQDLGLDEYFYNVLPEDKAKIVEQLQADGKVVCFIGDGINDTIALQRANVSMSIAGATTIAKDMAEIVFMDGTLNHLGAMMELSKRLDINLQRSLILCLVPTALNLLGAFVFKYSILTSLLINNGVALLGVSKVLYTKKRVGRNGNDLGSVPQENEQPKLLRVEFTPSQEPVRSQSPGC
jgi:heavy metal translocating P-type ATPase